MLRWFMSHSKEPCFNSKSYIVTAVIFFDDFALPKHDGIIMPVDSEATSNFFLA